MKWRRELVFLPLIILATLLTHPVMASIRGPAAGPGTFVAETVDSAGRTGTVTSLALDSLGNPYIAYRDDTNRALKLASKVRGAWRMDTVDPHAGSAFESSDQASNPIVLDARGDPSIAYTNSGMRRLSYAIRRGGRWTVEDVDATGPYVALPSLALDGIGNPSIAYVTSDDTAWYVKYASRRNGVWSVTTVATTPSGPGCSLALDSNGEPRIVFNYQDAPLTYVWRTGSTWAREIVDSTAEINPWGLSIALDSLGSPYVSYYTLFDKAAVRLASRQSGVWSHETVDSIALPQIFAEPDLWTSIALGPDGDPGIAYYSPYRLRLRYATKAGGAWAYTEPDTTGGTGFFASLARDRWGNPSISYFSSFFGLIDDLKYADSAVHILSPWGGERWKPGSTQPVEWAGMSAVTVLISKDGGNTYTQLGVGTDGVTTVTVPDWWTTSARIKVVRDVPYSESTSPGLFSVAPDPGQRLSLGPPHPNPVRGGGAPTIPVDIPHGGSVGLELYDASGRLVARMPQRVFVVGGVYPIVWDPGLHTSGVYFLRVMTDWGETVGTKWVQIR